VIGEVIDHYRILELVGRGAMGVVYKALDVNLDRQVAVKVMSAEARNDPDFVERFRQEARMQGALNHPNVAMLFDYFVHDGAPVAVMEFIDGESFEQLIRRRGAIAVRESIPIFKQALRGVAAAHRAGIIHRDLKPSNLMVTRDDIVKVMDFGIAKRQGSTGATKVSSTSIGSPLYMAPEQILGRAVDRRTDVYALGLTLYELVSGHRPFNPRGKAEFMVLNSHVNDTPEPPTVYRYGIPQTIVDAVMRSLAKDPDARFQSAEEFMAALPDLPAATVADATAADSAAAPLGPTGTVSIPRAPTPIGSGPTGTVALAKSPLPVAAGPTGTMAIPRSTPTGAGPTGTMAIPRPPPVGAGPTGTVAISRPPPPIGAGPTGTMAIPTAPPTSAGPAADGGRSDTVMCEYVSTTRRDAGEAVTFDYSASTILLQDSDSRRSVPSTGNGASPAVAATAAPAPGLMQRLRAHRPGLAAALVGLLLLGSLLRHADRLQTMRQQATPTPAQFAPTPVAATSVSEAPAPAADASPVTVIPAATAAASAAATSEPAAVAPPVTTPTLARPDLAGTWRGEYVDAAGKQLLRVVSLSIDHVYDDGGIEGTLQYQAASGDGECKLQRRGSSYSAGEQRLQLSPEACSPHHPRELGVPLDFVGVNPRGNTLKDGRIEAPTGEVIKVRLKRVSGV
jgi:serine/threonine protein kinase